MAPLEVTYSVPKTVLINDVSEADRDALFPLLDECFTGVYLWHARRTLTRVKHVRAARCRDEPVGLAMLSMLSPRIGYLYYIAVRRPFRGQGVGGLLLDDGIRFVRAHGATEILSCARRENVESTRLLRSRGLEPTRFRDAAHARGFRSVAALWRRMVVAPGEVVFRRAFE